MPSTQNEVVKRPRPRLTCSGGTLRRITGICIPGTCPCKVLEGCQCLAFLPCYSDLLTKSTSWLHQATPCLCSVSLPRTERQPSCHDDLGWDPANWRVWQRKRKEGDRWDSKVWYRIALPLFFLNTKVLKRLRIPELGLRMGVSLPKEISAAEIFGAWNHRTEMLPCQRF